MSRIDHSEDGYQGSFAPRGFYDWLPGAEDKLLDCLDNPSGDMMAFSRALKQIVYEQRTRCQTCREHRCADCSRCERLWST